MITFFDYLPSQNAFKVRLLLNHLQVPHVTRMVCIFDGEGQSPAYREINPTGAVPAIQLDDGRCIAESNAILGYLANDSPYLPNDRFDQAKVNQWLSFEQDYIQNTIGSLRYWTMTGKLANRPKEVVESRRNLGIKALSILDEALSSRLFICGENYTIADMSLYAYASRAEEAAISLAPLLAFRHWVARLEALPRFLPTVYPYSLNPHSSRELS